MMSNLPKDFKQKLYINIGCNSWDKGNVSVDGCDLSGGGNYVCVGSFDAEFDLSSFSSDINQKQIDLLQAKKVKIIAEHHQAIKRIDEQIQSLQAIENK